MNFRQSLYNRFLPNAQSLVPLVIAMIGLHPGLGREFSRLIGFLMAPPVAVGPVSNAEGIEDVLPESFDKITGTWKRTYHTPIMERALIASWRKSTEGLGSVTLQTI